VRLPSPGQRARKRLPRCERAAGKQQLRSSAASKEWTWRAASKQQQRAIPAAAGKAKEWPTDRDPYCCVLLLRFFFKLLHLEFRARHETLVANGELVSILNLKLMAGNSTANG